ncbi:PREDICTED: uncharacterized protein LOC108560271 isoform X2 [Nicrophorus vespilloides]|uniref:Uncharacterized protein LOC108560271 isoform X2 n=1 Tax=Nicrophorus vespilloides TaxID=110193 RepID=A0ABM1MF83_NICVS|nr:PREDICTED: uncharacterized protein LOC108560271 isoform X2 [Nicrophorus vespilloides]
MKDAINFLIPIVQDPLNDITTGRCVSHHVSMNGYYGYQPVAVGKEEDFRRPPQQNQTNNSLERMETNCDMDIQFNNCMEPEEDDSNAKREPAKQEPFKSSTRKRTLIDVDNCSSCKKRRQNEGKPRGSNQLGKLELVEELLRETHGSCLHHWLGHEF